VTSASNPTVSVHILGYNSRPYLDACLRALLDQTHRPCEIIFSDNASTDGSVEHVRRRFPEIAVLANDANLGYCGGHNRGIRASSGEFVIVLNPDVQLTPTFLETIVAAVFGRPEVGAATGRLRRCRFDAQDGRFRPIEPPVLDSTGVFLDRLRRGWDRGAGTPDDGRFATPELVFAACGAAAVYRRRMLEEVAEDGEYFDESFFLGFEDIDLGWRSQRAGWKCLYVPDAIGYHVRGVPFERGLLHAFRRGRDPGAAFRERHSLKNRYLMLLKNESAAELARDLPWLLAWELLRIARIAAVQPQMLPALLWFVRAAPGAIRRRRTGQTAPARLALRRWFGYV
jgi:GT2 family glycosyltransferase